MMNPQKPTAKQPGAGACRAQQWVYICASKAGVQTPKLRRQWPPGRLALIGLHSPMPQQQCQGGHASKLSQKTILSSLNFMWSRHILCDDPNTSLLKQVAQPFSQWQQIERHKRLSHRNPGHPHDIQDS